MLGPVRWRYRGSPIGQFGDPERAFQTRVFAVIESDAERRDLYKSRLDQSGEVPKWGLLN